MSSYLMLSYDVGRLTIDQSKLFVFVKNNRLIDDWISPYDGCLLLACSRGTVSDVSTSFYEFLGKGAPFFVSDMGDQGCYGAVPSEVWDWLLKPREGQNVEWEQDKRFDDDA